MLCNKCKCSNCIPDYSDCFHRSNGLWMAPHGTIMGPTTCSRVRFQRYDNQKGCTQLMRSAINSYSEAFYRYLKESIDVRTCDNNGSDALIYACGSPRETSILFCKELVAAGAKPNITNLWGLNAFLTAILIDNLECYVFLMSKFSEMFTDFVYSDGETVLHKVCRSKNLVFAKLLCEHISSDVAYALNNSGESPIDVWGDISYKSPIVEGKSVWRFEDIETPTVAMLTVVDEDEYIVAPTVDKLTGDVDNLTVEVDEAKEDLIAHLETIFSDLK